MTAIPRVSAVVAAYNTEPYVGDTVRSVLSQTFTDLELIVVDDGSTDRTAQVALAAIGDDPRGRVIRRAHEGEGAAKNAGIRAARADLLAMVDSDDLCHPNKLARQVPFMDAQPHLAASFTHIDVIDPRGAGRSWPEGESWFNTPLSGRAEILGELFAVRNHLCHPTVILRRAVLERVGPYMEDVFAPDLDLWFRILRQHDVAVLEEPLLSYRVRSDGLSLKTNSSARAVTLCMIVMRALQLYTLEEIYPALRDLPPGPDAARARAEAHLELAGHLERSNLLELLPMALHHRLLARVLAPELVRRESLIEVADRRTSMLARQLVRTHPLGRRVATAVSDMVRRFSESRTPLSEVVARPRESPGSSPPAEINASLPDTDRVAACDDGSDENQATNLAPGEQPTLAAVPIAPRASGTDAARQRVEELTAQLHRVNLEFAEHHRHHPFHRLSRALVRFLGRDPDR